MENKESDVEKAINDVLVKNAEVMKNDPSMIEIKLVDEKPEDNLPWYKHAWNFMKDHRKMMWRLFFLILFVIILVVAFLVLAKTGVLEKFLVELRKTGDWGLIIVAVGEIIAGLPLPNLFTLFAMFAGFAYGWWKAFVVCFPSAVVGYCVGFLFCRRFLRERVKKMMQEEFEFFEDVDEMIEQEGFKLVFLLRFSPIPFGILNMLLATTRIPFGTFVLAGIVPTGIEMAVFSYLGTTLQHISEALNSNHMSKVQIILIVVNILASIGVLITITLLGRRAYRQIQKKREEKKTGQAATIEVKIETSEQKPQSVETASSSHQL